MSLRELKIDVDAGTVTIVLNMEKKPRPSKTGKSLVIATSDGCYGTGQLINKYGKRANEGEGGKAVSISAVAYIEK